MCAARGARVQRRRGGGRGRDPAAGSARAAHPARNEDHSRPPQQRGRARRVEGHSHSLPQRPPELSLPRGGRCVRRTSDARARRGAHRGVASRGSRYGSYVRAPERDGELRSWQPTLRPRVSSSLQVRPGAGAGACTPRRLHAFVFFLSLERNRVNAPRPPLRAPQLLSSSLARRRWAGSTARVIQISFDAEAAWSLRLRGMRCLQALSVVSESRLLLIKVRCDLSPQRRQFAPTHEPRSVFIPLLPSHPARLIFFPPRRTGSWSAVSPRRATRCTAAGKR